MEIIKELEKLGLSDKEAKVYLAALQLGPSSISEIAKTAELKRPTVYLIIDDLIKKNLINKMVKKGRVSYSSANPENILSFLEGKVFLAKHILPELNAIYPSPIDQPKIKFYQGKNGLKNIYEEAFSSGANVFALVSLDKFFEIFSEDENAYFFSLLKNSGGRIYDLIEVSDKKKKYVSSYYRKGLSRIKELPPKFKIDTDILIMGNKIAMISFNNLTGLIIEDSHLAKTHKQIFRYLWKSVK